MKRLTSILILLLVGFIGCGSSDVQPCGCKTKGDCGIKECPDKDACQNCQCEGY